MRKLNFLLILLVVFAIVAFTPRIFPIPFYPWDWECCYWPQLQTPFRLNPGMFNIPYLYILLQPIRLLGKYPAYGMFIAGTFVSIDLISRRLRLSTWRVIMLLLSAPVIWCSLVGQIDGLILLGFVLPVPLGVLFGIAKPQAGLGAATGAFKRNPVLAVLVGLLLVGSAFLIWRWPTQMFLYPTFERPAIISRSWRVSFWPYGLVFLPWLFGSLRKRLAVSPLIGPLAGFSSLIGPMIATATLPALPFIAVWVALWFRFLLIAGSF